MILETFKSYLPCKLWLKKHAKDRDDFIFELNGTTIPGISYEEQVGGSSKTEGLKKAIISDEIDKYDKRHKHKVDHCNSTIRFCKITLNEVELKNRNLFRVSFMQEPMTSTEVGDQLGYHRTWVKRRIDAEIDRLETFE